MRYLAAVALMLTVLPIAASAQVAEVLGEVRVHGNHTTPDADILGIAGLQVGTPVTEAILRDAAERLRRSGRFDDVDVRKRYRSIDDPNDILVVILVNEVTGITSDDLMPGPLKKMRSLGMWFPVLDYADGYGFTYGARISFVDTFGKRSRISVPLTWGGERKAAVEVDRTFRAGPVTRIEGAASISRRENPHYEIGDTRREFSARAERALVSWLRVGGGARITNVHFGSADDTFVAPRFDVTVDTRTDPAFPRNAVHVVSAIEQLRFDDGPRIVRTTTDARGYIGLIRSSVLALRATTSQSKDPLPPYEQALLGGVSTLRGYDFGYRVGDNLATFSAEVRVPFTSPVYMGKFGLKAFLDGGTVYPAGQKLANQEMERGVGGGVFITWAIVRMGLDVAWPVTQADRKPNFHFGLGVTF